MGLSSMLGQNKMCFKNKLDPISHKEKNFKKSFQGGYDLLFRVFLGHITCFFNENTHILCIYDKTKTFILLCEVNILDLKISPTMARMQTFQISFILGDNSMIKKQREDVKHNVPVIKVTPKITCLILKPEINC